MKKTLALALAVMILCVCALTVSAAETNLPDTTFGGWWTAHSQGVQITEEGFTMTFTADTEDGAALNYCVPTVVIHAGSADAVGAEYWCQRADAWGWLYGENVGDHADALHAKGYSWNFVFEDSFVSWENFQATTEAGTQATVTAKLEGNNVLLTYKIAGIINEATIPVDAANPVFLCLTGERCAVSNIVVTTPDAEPAGEPKTITINGATFTAEAGKWLYNTYVNEIVAGNPENAYMYSMIIFDKNYTGEAFNTNSYGAAIVLNQYGELVRVYDGANGGFWTAEGKAASAHFTTATFATVAWAELQEGETLIIFPNDGASNLARAWALDLRGLKGTNYFGEIATLEGFTFAEKPADPEPTVPETTVPETTIPEATEPVTPEGPAEGGDAFGIVVALMAVSGIALVALKKKEN